MSALNWRKQFTVAIMAIIGLIPIFVGTSGCSYYDEQREERRVKFVQDLRSQGFQVQDQQVAWEDESEGSSTESILEAAFDLRLAPNDRDDMRICEVELERSEEDAANGSKRYEFEEVAGEDINKGRNAFTKSSPTVDDVRNYLRQAHVAKRFACARK